MTGPQRRRRARTRRTAWVVASVVAVAGCSSEPPAPVDPCAARPGEVAVTPGVTVDLHDAQQTQATLQTQTTAEPLTYRVGFAWATTLQSFDVATGTVLTVGDSTVYTRRVCVDTVLLTLQAPTPTGTSTAAGAVSSTGS